MPGFAGIGTSLVLLVAVLLWVAYLVPVWTRRREYLATERNAIRLQQTLRIMAESAEAPEEVRLEADARTIAVQQKAVAKEQRLQQALERTKAVMRARELDEQIRALEREMRVAVRSSVSRTQRLRRTRLACFALLAVALVAVLAGALVPALQVLVLLGAVVAVLAVAGFAAVNASAARMRRVAVSTAPQVRTLVEAREVAAEAVATESRDAEQVVARASARGHAGLRAAGTLRHGPRSTGATASRASTTDELFASRSWTPQPVPEQRLRAEYLAGDDLLQRARARLAEDRRAVPGPLARVTRLEPSFEEIVEGESSRPTDASSLGADASPSSRRADASASSRPTDASSPSPRADASSPSLRADASPSSRRADASAAMTQLPAPQAARASTEEPSRPSRKAAVPAPGATRYSAMGLVGDDLADLDVHEAFVRRVG